MRNNGRTKQVDPVDMLRDDLNSIKRDVGNLIKQRMSNMGDKARDVASGANDQVRAAAETAREKYGEAHDQIGEVTGKHPMRTILLAFVAGAVVTKIFGWSRR